MCRDTQQLCVTEDTTTRDRGVARDVLEGMSMTKAPVKVEDIQLGADDLAFELTNLLAANLDYRLGPVVLNPQTWPARYTVILVRRDWA